MRQVMNATPHELAEALATDLKADPVMAGMVKEWISPKELITLLGLDMYVSGLITEMAVDGEQDLFKQEH